jgi:predicted nucleotidyltransferase
MGQVFTWDAVRSGKIPTAQSFPIVAQKLREVLHAEPPVVFALLFGSVLRGDSNIRSDVDCLVIYEHDKEKQAMQTMHRLDTHAKLLHVPINFTPCDTTVARTRLHSLGSSFLWHLQTSIAGGGLIKGSLDLLAESAPLKLEIEQYVSKKMYTLTEARAQMATYTEDRLAAFLKKALEAPMHIARKMLVYEGTLRGDSKREVAERYRETMPAHMGDVLDSLLSADAWYTKELLRFSAKPEEAGYYTVLYNVRARVPEIQEFVRLNVQRLDKAVR